MPATPTPFAPGSPQISLPTFDLWQFTDWAIHGWQFGGTWTTVIQALLLLFVVGFGIILLQRWLAGLGNDQESEDGAE